MAVAGTRSVVKADWVFGMDLLGEDVAWPAPHGRSADPVAIRFGILWNKTLQTLLNSGQILTHPQQVRDTGLAGALEGIFEIRSAKGLPYKLVYTL
jgi:hypothetical protein